MEVYIMNSTNPTTNRTLPRKQHQPYKPMQPYKGPTTFPVKAYTTPAYPASYAGLIRHTPPKSLQTRLKEKAMNETLCFLKTALTMLAPALAPIVPGVCSVMLTHPADILLTTQQSTGQTLAKAFNNVSKNKTEWRTFYKGVVPPLAATIPQRSGQVFMRESVLNPLEYIYRSFNNLPTDDRKEGDTSSSRFKNYSSFTKLFSSVAAALPDSGAMVFSELYKVPDQLGISRPKITPAIVMRLFGPLATRDILSSISAFTLSENVSTATASALNIDTKTPNVLRDLTLKIFSVAASVIIAQPIITPFDNLKTAVAANPGLPLADVIKGLSSATERTAIFDKIVKHSNQETAESILGKRETLETIQHQVTKGIDYLKSNDIDHKSGNPIINTAQRYLRGTSMRMMLVGSRTGIAIGGSSVMLQGLNNIIDSM